MTAAALSKMKGAAPAGGQPRGLGFWVAMGLLLAILVGCAGRGRIPDVPPAPDALEGQAAIRVQVPSRALTLG